MYGSCIDYTFARQKNNIINKPFFLSGGIGLADIEKVKAFHHPFLYAVDINSMVETEPGIKDMEQVKQFVQELKETISKLHFHCGHRV